MSELVDFNDPSLDDRPEVNLWHRVLLLRVRRDCKSGGSLWPGRVVFRRVDLNDELPPRWWVYTESLTPGEGVYHRRGLARAIRIDTGPCENTLGPRLWVTLTLSTLGGVLISVFY